MENFSSRQWSASLQCKWKDRSILEWSFSCYNQQMVTQGTSCYLLWLSLHLCWLRPIQSEKEGLSVNARIVGKDRASLGEKTIVGLYVVKEAVRFYDPVHSRVEMIPITQELKKSVGTAYSAYKEWLQREREEEEKKKEEAKRKKEISERAQKEREKLMEKKESLTRSEEDLDEKEKKARMDVEVADELLNEASSKLDDALSSTPLNNNRCYSCQNDAGYCKGKTSEGYGLLG